MSTSLTEFTTYADIRAALGVTEDDLEDATLSLNLYSDSLGVEFEDVSSAFADTYATVRDIDNPSAVQISFLTATRLFATYAVAKQLTATLPVFASKQVSDGKTVVQRFDNPYRDTIKSVLDQYGKAKARLATVIATLNSGSKSTVTRVYFSVVAPSTDPITDSE